MTYEDKVLEYIAQPDNLPVALEVADAVQKLKDTVHRQFWPLFSTEVNQRVAHSEYAEKWIYVPFPQKRIKKEYEVSYLKPNQPQGTGGPVLTVMFGQGGHDNHYRLLSGVNWGRKLPPPNHPALKDFKKELASRKLTNSWDWWIGWKYLQYSLEGGEFLSKYYQAPNKAVEELADEYWNLFLDLHPLVESINQALAE